MNGLSCPFLKSNPDFRFAPVRFKTRVSLPSQTITCTHNAFAVMMTTQKDLFAEQHQMFPTLKRETQHGKDRLYNALIELFKEQKWPMTSKEVRTHDIFQRLYQCIWYLNNQQTKFKSRNCPLPSLLDPYLDYKAKHDGKLYAKEMMEYKESIGNLIDIPLLQEGSTRASLGKLLVQLYGCLTKYWTYLQEHSSDKLQHQQSTLSAPVFGQDDRQYKVPVPSTSQIATLRASKHQARPYSWDQLDTALSNLEVKSLLRLTELIPDERLHRRHVVDLIRKGALYHAVAEDEIIMMYEVKYRGNLRTEHFLWKLKYKDDNQIFQAGLLLVEEARKQVRKVAAPGLVREFKEGDEVDDGAQWICKACSE